MIITTQELIERYNIHYSTFQLKKPKLIEAGALYAKGKSGSDPWLWRSSVTDRLALSGALGNKARQAAVNRHHATACEEHF